MFAVKLITPIPARAQAKAPHVGGARHFVTITESRANEADEPRHFIRRAIYVLKAGQGRPGTDRKGALKVIGLIQAASLRTQAIGGWSIAGGYDPLPDFLELLTAAAPMFRRSRVGDDQVAMLRLGIEGTIASLREASATQRMANA